MIRNILTVILLSTYLLGFSNFSLIVSNPDKFSTYNGSISAAKLEFRPLGVYIQCEMFLDFSSGSYLNLPSNSPDDVLEIEYNFNF